jgi:hypothetical protein
MRKETGKKIISVFLIIIFMFNITGCATIGIKEEIKYTEKQNDNPLDINNVLNDINDKQKKRKENKIKAQTICGIATFVLCESIIYLRFKEVFDKGDKDDIQYNLGIVLMTTFGILSIISGLSLGDYLYEYKGFMQK